MNIRILKIKGKEYSNYYVIFLSENYTFGYRLSERESVDVCFEFSELIY